MPGGSRKRAASPTGSGAPQKRVRQTITTTTDSHSTTPARVNKRQAHSDIHENPRKKLKIASPLNDDSQRQPPESLQSQAKGIFDLPAELFQHIMKDVVDEDDPSSALNARLVSRTFNEEITAEIFWSGAFDKHFRRLPRKWRVRRLNDMAFSKRHQSNNLFFETVREVTQTVRRYMNKHSEYPRYSTLSRIFSLAMTFMDCVAFERAVFDKDCHWALALPDINHACVCLAIWLRDPLMYKYFQRKSPTPAADQKASPYFGTPVWVAALHYNLSMLKTLRDDGFYFDTPDLPRDRAPLVEVCWNLKSKRQVLAAVFIIETLLLQGLLIPETRTVVTFAHKARSFEMFRLLVDSWQCMEYISMVFLEECKTAETSDLLKYLLSCGADPDVDYLVRYGWPRYEGPDSTPLQIAATSGNSALVKLLLEHGADPDFEHKRTGADPSRPILSAMERHDTEMVDTLLRFGTKKYGKDTRNSYRFNILLLAWSHLPTFKAALAHFDMSNTEDDSHAYEALTQASLRNRPDIIRLLAEAGCSIHGRWEPPLKDPARPRSPDPGDESGHGQNLVPVTQSFPSWLSDADPLHSPALPPYHSKRKHPAIAFARRGKAREAEALLWELGAVHNYPYDVLLRKPGESADIVDGRAGPLRDMIKVRDHHLKSKRRWHKESADGSGKTEKTSEDHTGNTEARRKVKKSQDYRHAISVSDLSDPRFSAY